MNIYYTRLLAYDRDRRNDIESIVEKRAFWIGKICGENRMALALNYVYIKAIESTRERYKSIKLWARVWFKQVI